MEVEYVLPDFEDDKDYSSDDLDFAMEILVKADQIQKNPALMANIKQHAKKREGQIRSIQDIRDASYESANDSYKQKDSSENHL